jgi:hypothetical protein
MRINQRRVSNDKVIHCLVQRRHGNAVLSLEPLWHPMNRQQPRHGRLRFQPERQLLRVQQVAGEAAGPVRHLERGDHAVPVLPKGVEGGRPHVGLHAQRGAVDGALPVEGLLLVARELAEKGLVDHDERDEERGGRPLVELGVVGVVGLSLDVGYISVVCTGSAFLFLFTRYITGQDLIEGAVLLTVGTVNDAKDGLLFLARAVDGGVEEARRRLQAVEDAVGKVGVLVRALGEPRVRKLAQDGKLPARQVDGVVDVVFELVRLGNGFENVRLLEGDPDLAVAVEAHGTCHDVS